MHNANRFGEDQNMHQSVTNVDPTPNVQLPSIAGPKRLAEHIATYYK